MALLYLVGGMCCCDYFAQGSSRLIYPKVIPLLLYILIILLCTGFPGRCREKPIADEETALPTVECRRVGCDVLPAECAVTTRVVSPDPTPVGFMSSAISLQLFKVFCASCHRD